MKNKLNNWFFWIGFITVLFINLWQIVLIYIKPVGFQGPTSTADFLYVIWGTIIGLFLILLSKVIKK